MAKTCLRISPSSIMLLFPTSLIYFCELCWHGSVPVVCRGQHFHSSGCIRDWQWQVVAEVRLDWNWCLFLNLLNLLLFNFSLEPIIFHMGYKLKYGKMYSKMSATLSSHPHNCHPCSRTPFPSISHMAFYNFFSICGQMIIPLPPFLI
jgi:hypothetical protein